MSHTAEVLQLRQGKSQMATENNYPKPLTPSDSDLSNFPYFPLDAVKFRDSDFSATVDPASGFYAVTLWAVAWHQQPAASLPDDDRILAKMAGFGRFVDEWLKVKEGALYGFIKCSDGRLYHKHLAEHANKAWDKSRKAKAAISARWGKESENEITGKTEEKHNDSFSNTDVYTNEIQREERRGEERKGEDIKDTLVKPSGRKEKKPEDANASCVSPESVIKIFNSTLPDLPEVKKLTPARRSTIKARAADGLRTEADWKAFLLEVKASDFLMGTTGQFCANFDWLIKPANCQKVQEGNYRNRTQSSAPQFRAQTQTARPSTQPSAPRPTVENI